jgi:bacteriorhodopsin
MYDVYFNMLKFMTLVTLLMNLMMIMTSHDLEILMVSLKKLLSKLPNPMKMVALIKMLDWMIEFPPLFLFLFLFEC